MEARIGIKMVNRDKVNKGLVMYIKELEFYQFFLFLIRVWIWEAELGFVVSDSLISSSTTFPLIYCSSAMYTSTLSLYSGILLKSVWPPDLHPLTSFKTLLKGQLLG